jgi:hypothetical protein
MTTSSSDGSVTEGPPPRRVLPPAERTATTRPVVAAILSTTASIVAPPIVSMIVSPPPGASTAEPLVTTAVTPSTPSTAVASAVATPSIVLSALPVAPVARPPAIVTAATPVEANQIAGSFGGLRWRGRSRGRLRGERDRTGNEDHAQQGTDRTHGEHRDNPPDRDTGVSSASASRVPLPGLVTDHAVGQRLASLRRRQSEGTLSSWGGKRCLPDDVERKRRSRARGQYIRLCGPFTPPHDCTGNWHAR